MSFRRRRKKSSTLAATRVALQAVRDSADVLPPLKSAAAAMAIVWDMTEKTKANKNDCKRLAGRATEIIGDIWRQTRDYGVDLPVEAQRSIEEIEKIICNVVTLMKDLQKQNLIHRYAHQDENRNRLEEQSKLLGAAIQRFEMNLQIGVLETSLRMKGALLELDDVSRERHDEILTLSQMSDKEREQLLMKILGKSRGPRSSDLETNLRHVLGTCEAILGDGHHSADLRQHSARNVRD